MHIICSEIYIHELCLCFQLSELNEEGLIQLSVSAELAHEVLQLLSQQCLGCTQSDLQCSHVYLKYGFSKGWANQSYQDGGKTPGESGSLSDPLASKTPKESNSAEEAFPAPSSVKKTDTQLNKELFNLEELSFSETLDEKAKGECQPAAWPFLHNIHKNVRVSPAGPEQ